MNELIKVHYDSADRPTVSGRELHEALGVETPYTTWVKRMYVRIRIFREH